MAAPGYFERHPERLDELAQRGGGNNLTYDGFVRTVQAVNAFDERNRVAAIQSPTLVVWGEADPMISREGAAGLVERIPHARLVVVPGAGHVAFLEKTEEVTRIVLDFLRAPLQNSGGNVKAS